MSAEKVLHYLKCYYKIPLIFMIAEANLIRIKLEYEGQYLQGTSEFVEIKRKMLKYFPFWRYPGVNYFVKIYASYLGIDLYILSFDVA